MNLKASFAYSQAYERKDLHWYNFGVTPVAITELLHIGIPYCQQNPVPDSYAFALADHQQNSGKRYILSKVALYYCSTDLLQWDLPHPDLEQVIHTVQWCEETPVLRVIYDYSVILYIGITVLL